MKIIVTNGLKQHMKCHEHEFVRHWEIILKELKQSGVFRGLTEAFEIVKVELPDVIGWDHLVETCDEDEIVYEKRAGRTIETRFVKGKGAVETNRLVCILKKSKDRPREYYVVTMYPGAYAYKEPGDLSIEKEEEREACESFWQTHALVWDERA